jgi:threonine synthase
MRYFSTRDNNISLSSSQAIIKGISDDGGLFVPEEIPIIEDIQNLKGLDYKSLAYEILSL